MGRPAEFRTQSSCSLAFLSVSARVSLPRSAEVRVIPSVIQGEHAALSTKLSPFSTVASSPILVTTRLTIKWHSVNQLGWYY